MSAENRRKSFTPEEKVKILREHLERKVPVSEICQAYGIDPSQLSQWKKAFFEGGAQAFASRGRPRRDESDSNRRVHELEQELQRMQLVVSEIAAENIELKQGLAADHDRLTFV